MKLNNLIVYALTALCVVACNNPKAETSADQVEQDTIIRQENGPYGDEDQLQADLIERVRDIYADVQKTYSNNAEIPNSNRLDSTYCSKSWNETVANVLQVDGSSSDEVGFFDADYWIMGQDFQDISTSDYKVEKLLVDNPPKTAAVTLNLHNCGSITPVRVDLIWEEGKWMIDNLTDLQYDVDWKKNMQDFLSEH